MPRRGHSLPHFLFGILLGWLVAAGLWLALWAGQLGRSHPNNAWIEASIATKLALAESLESPKLVTLAGSGALFGIDSAMLETHYARPAVNLGVNAGISLPVILETATPVIAEDDLVLLPLEYPLYDRREPVSSSLVHWMNGHPEMLRWLPPERAARVVALTSLGRILEGYRGMPEGFTISGDYGPHRIDARGDQIGTELAAREERHWRFLNSLPAERYGEQLARGSLDLGRLLAFRDTMLERGACPIFLPPALAFEPSYRHDPVEREFYASLGERLEAEGLMWVGNPFEAMYPKQAFFDTNFHLHADAREAHTRRVITWLGKYPMARCQEFYRDATAR